MRKDVIDQLVREGLADRLWAKVCERAGYKCAISNLGLNLEVSLQYFSLYE